MNTDDILKDALKMVIESKHKLRLGQAVYIVASARHPEVKTSIATPYDPYYHDDRIRSFITWCGRLE